MARMPRYNPKGPLLYSVLREINECRWWDKTRPPVVAPQDDDFDCLIMIGDAPDALALGLLNDDALGHLIMERNDTDDYTCRLWPNDFVPGRTIQIPTRSSLERRRII
jgi:hypothetical protein